LPPFGAGGTAVVMIFRIRIAYAGDVSAMHAVRSKVRENRLSDPYRITEASYLPYIEAGSMWVAETEAGLAGFAAIDAPGASVWALFVDPDAEGAGIGRALHHRMLEFAREQGIRRLSLSTQDGSRALNFYERAGWTRAGTVAEGEVLLEKLLSN
jgi:GNAT superfamily N-acetyltransferase